MLRSLAEENYAQRLVQNKLSELIRSKTNLNEEQSLDRAQNILLTIANSLELKKWYRIVKNEPWEYTQAEKVQQFYDVYSSVASGCLAAAISLLLGYSPTMALIAGLLACYTYLIIRIAQSPDKLIALNDKIIETINSAITPTPEERQEIELMGGIR